MRPALHPGDRLVLLPGWLDRLGGGPRRGDLVAVPDPRVPSRVMVKRVAATGRREVRVVGDNLERSTDSRHFGPVTVDRVRGRVVYRYHPPDRRGRLTRGCPPGRGRRPAVLWVSC